MTWIDRPQAGHDERTKELAALLSKFAVRRQDAEDLVAQVPGLDPALLLQQADFRALRYWTATVIDVRQQGCLRALVELAARRYTAYAEELSAFLGDSTPLTAAPSSAVPTSWRSSTDPVDARFVGTGRSRPIFDRSQLRQRLREMRDEGFLTLNITGEPRSGKSFSLHLVKLLCDENGASHVVVRVEDSDAGRLFHAVDVVETIALQLGIDLDVRSLAARHEDASTAARVLFNAILHRLEPPVGTTRWIVVDGLDRPNVDRSAVLFVERLLTSIEETGTPGRTYLVVTGFDGTAPPTSIRDMTEEITADDVESLITTVTDGCGRPLGRSERLAWVEETMRVLADPQGGLPEAGGLVFRRFQEHFAAGVAS